MVFFVGCLQLLVTLLSVNLAYSSQPHVCILGGGIAAASTSYFLTNQEPHPRITVFEKTDRVGGRIATLNLPSTPPIEAGASIIAKDNALMSHFVDVLNLTRVVKESSGIGFWNGTAFVFRSQPSSFRTILTLLLRYRLSLIRSKLFVRQLLHSYSKLYPSSSLSSNWAPCGTVQALLARAAPLYALSQRRFKDLAAELFSPIHITEMVAAITRVNYGQDPAEMNGMSGAVGLAGSGGGLWAVKGGNEKVVSGLLERAGVELLLNTTVTRVEKSDEGYIIWSGENDWVCDGIVVAMPAELAGVEFPDNIQKNMDTGRKFQRTVATFVQGSLNEETFGADPPESVLTTENVKDVFTAVGKVHSDGESSIFKVFSKDPLDTKAIRRIFASGAQVVAEYPWLAYPKFSPPEQFAKFDADDGGALVYTSPLESAGSAMEMSAVAGANAAAIIRQKLNLYPHDQKMSSVKEEL